MGNCITSTAIPAEPLMKNEPPREAEAANKTAAACGSSTFRTAKRVEDRKEKTVRFRLRAKDSSNGRENCRETKTGVVRIRLVLTQNELNQILNGQLKNASAEQLLSVIKSRSKRDSRGRSSSDLEGNGNWMPALESIPENNHHDS